MNKEKLTAAGIAYDEGLDRFMGNSALYEKMLAKFAADGSFSAARARFAEGDWKSFQESIHTLKGVSGNLSLNGIFAVTSEIMRLLRADERAEVPALMDKLEKEYAAAIAAIDSLRGE